MRLVCDRCDHTIIGSAFRPNAATDEAVCLLCATDEELLAAYWAARRGVETVNVAGGFV